MKVSKLETGKLGTAQISPLAFSELSFRSDSIGCLLGFLDSYWDGWMLDAFQIQNGFRFLTWMDGFLQHKD